TRSELDGIKAGETTTLKKLMLHVVKSGQIGIIPDNFEKIYFNWINDLHDWCISRQIWYGHRIPVWYRGEETHIGTKAPDGNGWGQDPDTLDTWFSSGLWTFSTLGWPEKTKDFETYHPTNILETGYDILFFWVARMVLMSTYLTGQVPFKKVYLHGLVRDGKGQKMSKSLGNIIDPVDMIDKYGADAVRLSLIIGTAPGNDSKLSEDKIRGYKHFANKIWNAARFVVSNLEDFDVKAESELTEVDADELANFNVFKKRITEYLENYKFYLAGDELYHYFWYSFADRIIEGHKDILYGDKSDTRVSAQKLLYTLLVEQVKLLHPFMPFVTEELWSLIPHNEKEKLLMIAKWPE
ncbi:MAG: class I tRNA ligase family protein, partial [Candidatus Paceibacterota bacterium]